MQSLEPHWTAYLTALSTPCIAIFAAWIAFQQWKLSRSKLRFDLFEKRWAVYASTNEVLASLLEGSDEERRACVKDFRRSLLDAQFLFGDQVMTFLRRVDQRVYELVTAERTLRDTPFEDVNRKGAEKRVSDELQACRADYDSLVAVFRTDMHIRL
jgi:hypothetical protein